MKPFSYMRAYSADSALNALSAKSSLMAGGIDLLGELKEGLVEPDTLISVKAIPELDAIEQTTAGWRLGANVTLAELASHEELGKALPAITEAARRAASPQIRNVSTIGGNLAQHSRCWYYRHRDVHCLKKGGSTCFAQEGQNKYHSLFTGSRCLSPLVSNLATALSALDATVVLRRRAGDVRMPIAKLYEKAWAMARMHNSLTPEEMITAIEIPFRTAPCAYLQKSEKSEFDWALVSCATRLELDETGTVKAARIVLGVVAPIPYRDERAENSLVGGPVDETRALAAADLLLRRARAQEHNAYKIPLARALIKRALLQAAANATAL